MAEACPSLEEILEDPTMSYPLKAVLLVWIGRDPVDAANDAAVLSAFMDARVCTALERRRGP